ncbi:serine hydrolase FSH [Hypomontagnella monticulosa]|nr:serine hydrolase FSH [Hypomontagnella monticulosa]
MRFLCLHGTGTNSRIFETQTAALRYELGDHHKYEFVEGTHPTDIAPELRENFSMVDEFFAYADFEDPDSCAAALGQLDSYIAAEGPFDGVIAFSQGAALAVAYLAQKWMQNSSSERLSPTFKCAVLFSSRNAYEPTLQLLAATPSPVASPESDIIQIPTAHIWGRNDLETDMTDVMRLCTSDGRETYVHDGGHEVPGARMTAAVRASVQMIRRVVSSALYKQM